MKRHRRIRRNPTGTLLVNPGGGRRKRRAARHGRGSLSSLLRSLGRRNPLLANPRKRRKAHSRRRNPLLANPKRHRMSRRHRRNPLMMNPHRRKHVRRHRRNPLLANPRRHKARKHIRRHRRNPLLANPRRRSHKVRAHRRHNPIRIRRRSMRRRNPGLVSKAQSRVVGFQRKAGSILGKVPVIGGVLASGVGLLGAALGGAVGVYPVTMAMPYVARYMPDMVKPFAYTIVGSVVGGVIQAFPDRWVKIPYKGYIATAMASAGGALDAYRYKMGQSKSLGSLMLAGPDGYGDADDFGDIGDVGNDGSPRACHEYAGTDLGDADYAGDDLSAAEIAAAELGRQHYWMRFRGGRRGGSVEDGASDYAGKPGLRHGWLIYWIGFDNFQKLAMYPENKRREVIQQMKSEAKMRARKLLQEGADTSVEQAEMAGLLAS